MFRKKKNKRHFQMVSIQNKTKSTNQILHNKIKMQMLIGSHRMNKHLEFKIWAPSNRLQLLCVPKKRQHISTDMRTRTKKNSNRKLSWPYVYSVFRVKPSFFQLWQLIQFARKSTFGANNDNHKKKLLSSLRSNWWSRSKTMAHMLKIITIIIFVFHQHTIVRIFDIRPVICSFVNFPAYA